MLTLERCKLQDFLFVGLEMGRPEWRVEAGRESGASGSVWWGIDPPRYMEYREDRPPHPPLSSPHRSHRSLSTHRSLCRKLPRSSVKPALGLLPSHIGKRQRAMIA
jgi:hypothetical protein